VKEIFQLYSDGPLQCFLGLNIALSQNQIGSSDADFYKYYESDFNSKIKKHQGHTTVDLLKIGPRKKYSAGWGFGDKILDKSRIWS